MVALSPEALRSLYDAGREAWPALALDLAAFETAVRERSGASSADQVHAVDLYLAVAVCQRVPGAVEAFEQEHGALFRSAVPSRVRGASVLPEDFESQIRQHVLVGNPTPLLERYGGRGALGGWVRVTVARAAISAVRKGSVAARREAELPDVLGVMAAQQDPEIDYLRRLYADAMREAFAEAVEALTDRERSLVRLSLVSGVSVRKLGTMYGVGRSTAARWVRSAVSKLSATVRARLSEHLGADSADLDSIGRLLDSHLDLSVHRILAKD